MEESLKVSVTHNHRPRVKVFEHPHDEVEEENEAKPEFLIPLKVRFRCLLDIFFVVTRRHSSCNNASSQQLQPRNYNTVEKNKKNFGCCLRSEV